MGAAAGFNGISGPSVDAAGNVYVADSANNTIRKITPAGAVSTLAGKANYTGGSANGVGAAASFNAPSGTAMDAAGNVYVADSWNFTIRKITPAGAVSIYAGQVGVSGSTDGPVATATLGRPLGVAVDATGNVYVADYSVVRKITPAGVVSTLAGSAGVYGHVDGVGAAATFYPPMGGVAVDAAGNVYVADSGNSLIREITPAGVVTTFAGTPPLYTDGTGGSGYADGQGTAAKFSFPMGVAVDAAGNVYVADDGNLVVRKITPAGMVSTFAGTAGVSGHADGTGAGASFNIPLGVAVDAAGNVYVADGGNLWANNTLRKITPTGVVSTMAGSAGGASGSADGTGVAASFFWPRGGAVDAAGNVYVADTSNHTIRKITPTGDVSTFAGSAGSYGSADGTGSGARFKNPTGVAIDAAGTLYVADSANNTIRKITPAGLVTTLAGTAGAAGSADGTGAAARFKIPWGVAVDAAGNVYVTDPPNRTIRKITPAGVVSTLAGTAGKPGTADGLGSAARFMTPRGLAVDAAGNVYVADTAVNTIRMITPGGMVSTFAGTASYSGTQWAYGSADGTGAAASFNAPLDVAVDAAGNLFVTDANNDTVRKITPAAVVSTVVGVPGVTKYLPGPLPASLGLSNSALGIAQGGIAVDPATGNLFITTNCSVMKVRFQ